ncbi:hypothetical protein ABH926_004032 [Catenulispora sp. GP43]|uniref:hypothetical protein n=1 Tax=Catenulispora sp. GP43 TaxID=3156263 RepID=UPI0035148FAB
MLRPRTAAGEEDQFEPRIQGRPGPHPGRRARRGDRHRRRGARRAGERRLHGAAQRPARTGDLWISNADGTGARLLDKATGPVVDHVDAADIFPQWMDDSTVVFARNNGGGNFQVNADGTGRKPYTAPGGLKGQLVFGPGGLVAAIASNAYTFNISI